MMQIRVLLLCVVALGVGVLAQSGQDESAVRRKIVGTWKLMFEEDTLKDGSKTHEFGPNGKVF